MNMIKPYSNYIITPCQSSFILGRNIHHNVIAAQETVQPMFQMKRKKLFISIKIDLKNSI